MKYEELIILLPCHSLEDFPLYHEGEEAQGLLANWVALWHPALIAAAGAMPIWRRVDDPPEELADRLIVIPSVSTHELPTGFAQRAKSEGACVVRRKQVIDEIQQTALDGFDGEQSIDQDTAADFLALGYCYLQVELLTRQMRYSSNLDEVHFQNLVVTAAEAACAHADDARDKLAACFDLLGEERDHYYPVDAYLLDLVMVAETTLGEALQAEFDIDSPTNLLFPAALWKELADSQPERVSAIATAWGEGRLSVLTARSGRRSTPGGDSGSRRICRKYSPKPATSARCMPTLTKGSRPKGVRPRSAGKDSTVRRSTRWPARRWTRRNRRHI